MKIMSRFWTTSRLGGEHSVRKQLNLVYFGPLKVIDPSFDPPYMTVSRV